jgi:DNA-binding MarR family transcriptional regulator
LHHYGIFAIYNFVYSHWLREYKYLVQTRFMADDRATTSPDPLAEQIDAVLLASRVLVSLSAKSLAAVEDVLSLTQLRILVTLASRGPMSVTQLSEAVDVSVSTGSRVSDKLVGQGLISRRQSVLDRRNVTLSLSPRGQGLVRSVGRQRRAAAEDVLRRMPRRQRAELVPALLRFAAAGGEPSTKDLWRMGWTT